MGLFDRFRSQSEPNVKWSFDRLGLDFTLSKKALLDPISLMGDDTLFGFQYSYLRSLVEQNIAVEIANGYHVEVQNVCLLEEDFADCFELPALYQGKITVTSQGLTGQSAFHLKVDVNPPGETMPVRYEVDGPFLRFSANEVFRLDEAHWDFFRAIDRHQASSKTEYDNNFAIFELQKSEQQGVDLSLVGAFAKIDVVKSDRVGVSAEMQADGSMVLIPALGEGMSAEDVHRRLGQVQNEHDKSIIKVRNKFVLLDDERLKAVHEIISNRHIPKDQVTRFLQSPSAYLDASLVDLDTGFSLRVNGAQLFKHHYFGEDESSGIEWTGSSTEPLHPRAFKKVVRCVEDVDELEDRVEAAASLGAQVLEFEGELFDLSDIEAARESLTIVREQVSRIGEEEDDDLDIAPPQKMVAGIDANDESLDFIQRAEGIAIDGPQTDFDLSNLKRTPFPHQNEGVRWLVGHIAATHSLKAGGGALLADDMGLGKTFMTLVAIAEWYRRCEAEGRTSKPCMVVAPLSLLENWADEINETFNDSPFSDVITLQSNSDLKRFKIQGASRETLQSSSDTGVLDEGEIKYSLKIGKEYGVDRLDLPRRLVLTTYQTLRDYQFSLSRVDWSVVAFDEAQNIKNPNSMATIAAAALRADFKLLASGTPVENSLKDLWSLMNVAMPGLLGAWQDFRAEYIAPIIAAEKEEDPNLLLEKKLEVGQQLRERLDLYMLRRTKEGQLEGLPKKEFFMGVEGVGVGQFDEKCRALMTGSHLAAYDELLDQIRHGDYEGNAILAALQNLKLCSIHPAFLTNETLPTSKSELQQFVQNSQKLSATMDIIGAIKQRGEKVIIFATTKKIQRMTAGLIQSIFGVPVEIINGDTKAVSKSGSDETRKGIIDKFQGRPGFGAIVMSPIAAGVGLTVVGANNVIHLERHWNPAKEAQATDRVYRIGQKRDVNVYIPMALHPSARSFDENINILLSKKVDLSDAVVAQPDLAAKDIIGGIG